MFYYTFDLLNLSFLLYYRLLSRKLCDSGCPLSVPWVSTNVALATLSITECSGGCFICREHLLVSFTTLHLWPHFPFELNFSFHVLIMWGPESRLCCCSQVQCTFVYQFKWSPGLLNKEFCWKACRHALHTFSHQQTVYS